MKYSEDKMAKLKAIQDHYKNTPKTQLPNTRAGISSWAKPVQRVVQVVTDVFGNPVGVVSPRVQRIRDLQAGKRVAPKRQTMVWHESPAKQSTMDRQAKPTIKPHESYEDWTKRMESAMDEAADYMEGKS